MIFFRDLWVFSIAEVSFRTPSRRLLRLWKRSGLDKARLPSDLGLSIVVGVHQIWCMIYSGKSIYKWKIWEYPHFRKPPFENLLDLLWKPPIDRQFFPPRTFTVPCLTSGDLQSCRDYENPPRNGSRCGMLLVDLSCFTEFLDVFLPGLTWSPFCKSQRFKLQHLTYV